MEDAWGGQEVEAQASLARREEAGGGDGGDAGGVGWVTFSPGSLGLVSGGPPRAPEAPLVVTDTTREIFGRREAAS